MELKVNGQQQNVADAQTVARLLESREVGAASTGVAVAVNDAVVPRSQWASHVLRDGDTVEIIHAVQGG